MTHTATEANDTPQQQDSVALSVAIKTRFCVQARNMIVSQQNKSGEENQLLCSYEEKQEQN